MIFFFSFFFFFLLSRVSKIHLIKYIFNIIEFYFRDLISRNLGLKLFFRSLHLTAPNFFLWGCLKVKVHIDKQRIIYSAAEGEHLNRNAGVNAKCFNKDHAKYY